MPIRTVLGFMNIVGEWTEFLQIPGHDLESPCHSSVDYEDRECLVPRTLLSDSKLTLLASPHCWSVCPSALIGEEEEKEEEKEKEEEEEEGEEEGEGERRGRRRRKE